MKGCYVKLPSLSGYKVPSPPSNIPAWQVLSKLYPCSIIEPSPQTMRLNKTSPLVLLWSAVSASLLSRSWLVMDVNLKTPEQSFLHCLERWTKLGGKGGEPITPPAWLHTWFLARLVAVTILVATHYMPFPREWVSIRVATHLLGLHTPGPANNLCSLKQLMPGNRD